MMDGDDTEEFGLQFKRPDGYFVSKTRAIILAVIAIGVIILVGVLAGVLSRGAASQCGQNGNTSPTMAPVTPATAKPVSPYAAVNNIRLPKNVIPIQYWFELEIDMNQLVFNGTNTAELNITSQTNLIIFHIKDLEITAAPKVARDRAFNNQVSVKEHNSFKPNEYYYIVLNSPASVGIYYVNFKFKAPLSTALSGLYKSSYTKPDGSKK